MKTLLPQLSQHTLDEYAPPAGDVPLYHADAHLLVVNKPAGLLSVPGRQPSMQDCLIHRVQQQFPDALVVHRLDMATSGLMLLARGAEMQRRLSAAFAARQVEKSYIALACGLLPQDSGELAWPLMGDWLQRPRQKTDPAGKPALTRYRVLARDVATRQSRVWLEPVTGRTHQLRVHMLALGHPLLGDALYGGSPAPRLMLHAATLALAHPHDGRWLQWQSAPDF